MFDTRAGFKLISEDILATSPYLFPRFRCQAPLQVDEASCMTTFSEHQAAATSTTVLSQGGGSAIYALAFDASPTGHFVFNAPMLSAVAALASYYTSTPLKVDNYAFYTPAHYEIWSEDTTAEPVAVPESVTTCGPDGGNLAVLPLLQPVTPAATASKAMTSSTA